ncbi:MAG: hypothetical protein K2X91_12370, partial [Thermoleophilia bacterium]|nr:hypothetical protein [Thermoleophilia bacterium]
APTLVCENGLEHIDAPGVLSITRRRGAGGGASLLFARTPLLERLGVPGGCAEPPDLVEGE